MAAPGILDPTKTGQYPVILSDALLGKSSKETYTGIRYNHRPTLSSDTAPNTARLKKSGKDESFNLGFDDQGDKYQFNGVRTTDDGNYVLIFDPARKAFVLHRVDSTFHMNITRTPTDSNVESLRKQFPQLEVKSASSTKLPKGKAAQKAGPGKAKDSKNAAAEDTPKTKGSSKSERNKAAMELTLPDLTLPVPSSKKKPEPSAARSEPSEQKSKRPALSPVGSEEDDDDDDDGGLTVEYPEGNPAAFRGPSQYPPTFPAAVTRRFSEFANERASDEDDFDTRMTGGYDAGLPEEEGYEEGDEYEEEDEDEDDLFRQPPSPARPSKMEVPAVAVEPDRYTFDDGDEDSDANGNDTLDQDIGELEAMLEREFDKAQNGGDGHESDSSVSEEE
ncbi:RNA polymerase II transcription elongation factor-domain-containing protein [Chaetomidium leptoderma]|uniref:RNA polymerase II transcription elongation factor-domain-containing protein n=1 Tax=Chaetomidium leptoderma TaxID=669021 RepID=A0AAN6VPR7_9PEZI|nr:RNA polymerase II transcription elongation factor-domain-containing protein [Chaetomidium leptoderma]